MFYDYKFTYCYDPLTNCDSKLKAEPDMIKQEIIDHCDFNLDNNSELHKQKIYFEEETENVYFNQIETKRDDNSSRKQEIGKQSEDSSDNIHDFDEKSSDFNEEIYTDIVATNQSYKLLRKKCVNGVKIKTDLANEKLYAETTENVNIEPIKKKSSKCRLKASKSKKDLEREAKEFEEKFVRVVLSEEEMLRVREEKRNHYNFKKIPYKCDSCVLGFTREETYSLHMRKKHDEVCKHIFFQLRNNFIITSLNNEYKAAL